METIPDGTVTEVKPAVQKPSNEDVLQQNPNLITCTSGFLVLSSTGVAAEYNGDMLGEYEEEGKFEGKPFFKQRDTEGSTDKFLCTRFWGNRTLIVLHLCHFKGFSLTGEKDRNFCNRFTAKFC